MLYLFCCGYIICFCSFTCNCSYLALFSVLLLTHRGWVTSEGQGRYGRHQLDPYPTEVWNTTIKHIRPQTMCIILTTHFRNVDLICQVWKLWSLLSHMVLSNSLISGVCEQHMWNANAKGQGTLAISFADTNVWHHNYITIATTSQQIITSSNGLFIEFYQSIW